MRIKSYLAVTLCLSMLLGISPAKAVSDLPLKEQFEGNAELNFSFDDTDYQSYSEYRENAQEIYLPDKVEVTVPVDDIQADGKAAAATEALGKPAYHWQEGVKELSWSFQIPEEGLYNLSLACYLDGDNAYSVKRNLLVDGEVPFAEAIGIAFNRNYQEINKGRVNTVGDQLRGQNVPIKEWLIAPLIDNIGICDEPFAIYFTAGTHSITLQYEEKDMYVGELLIQSAKQLPTYEAVKNSYAEQGYLAPALDKQVDFQAEEVVLYANDVTIRRETSTDITVTPYRVEQKLLNTYGGSRWKTGNQSITMEITVPKTGLYQLAFHSNQNMTDGLPVYRQIMIDGEVPFQEMLAYEFPYTSNYQTNVIQKEDGSPYLFYLEEGRHTISLIVKRGRMQFVAESLEADMTLLSKIQLDISSITGNEADPNYDYEFFVKIPDLEQNLRVLSESLQQKIDYIKTLTGRTPSVASSLKSIKAQIDDMIEDPFSIARNIADLGNSQTQLGTWYLSVLNAGMTLDTISLAPANSSFQPVKRSFWKLLWANIQTLILSFTRSYNEVSGYIEEGVVVNDEIDVWVARGTSWAELIKEMADTKFTPKTGIEINVNTVPASQLNAGSANVLMLSIVSGRQPDVAMAVAQNSPVEFAIRDAVVDLSRFSDYAAVAERFYSEILVPYRYQGGVYALPETMDFKVMFYRKDVISKLGISLPDTREELYSQTLPALYNEGLSFHYPRDDSEFILQHGGTFYTEDGLRSALDSPEAFEGLTELTELYTQYSIPITSNFYNRFRTGEMPMGVSNYSLYLQLLSAAPEISGRWGIAPVPGLKKEDGTVDRSVAAFNSVADIILSGSGKEEKAWEFLEWWTSFETQTEFAREVEALLGAEARWNTANVKAFESLPWKTEDLKVIKQMLEADREMPVVLGGYYTTRHLTNAFNNVVMNGEMLRDSLEEAVEAINKELKMKQEEYGVSE